MPRRPSARLLSVPVLAALLALPACSPPLGTAPATPLPSSAPAAATPGGEYRSVRLKGRAFAGQPVVGATIRVEDLAGKLLLEAPAKTGSAGTFAFDAPTLADQDLRVVITGGTLGGAPFTGTLMAEIAKFHGGLHLAYANPATTVAARYRAASGKAIAEAVKATQAYLGLAPSVSLGADLDNPVQTMFSEAKFMTAAGLNGGLDAYTAAVAGEVAKGGATSAFRAYRYATQGILEGIGNGILGAIGGAVFNTVLGAVGLDAAANQRQQILDEVRAVSAQIDQLSADVHAIGNEVHTTRLAIASLDNRFADLQAAVNRLAWNTARDSALTNYNNAEDTMAPAISAIETAWEQYNFLIDHAAEATAADVQDFQRSFSPDTLRTHMTTIHNVATGGGTPGITRWMRAYGFKAMADGRYPYMVDEAYFNGALAMPRNVDAVLAIGTRLVKELATAQAFNGAPPTSTPLSATQAETTYRDRAAAIKGLIWYGDLPASAYTTVVGSPLKGLIWSGTPVNVQATVRLSGQTYQTNGYGFNDTVQFTPDPSTVQPTSNADGTSAGWRWPTHEEALGLGKTAEDRAITHMMQRGFDLGRLPISSTSMLSNGMPGIWALYTSSVYANNDRFKMGLNLSGGSNEWMSGDTVFWVYDPSFPSAVIYIPVKKLRDEPVAAEFAQF